MSRTDYMREYLRRWRERHPDAGEIYYYLNGGRQKAMERWAANKDEINARRREKRKANGNGSCG